MIRMTALLGLMTSVAFAPAAHAQRGSDGTLRLIYHQAVSILNPYLSGGTKDIDAASLVLEPLAGFDENGHLVPRLAEAVPTVENGGVAADRRSVTWRLRPDLRWSDGSPVTAEDVVFTHSYCTHPEGACAQLAKFAGVTAVESVDPLTVRISFDAPKANPWIAFTGASAPILQKAQFAACLGAAAASCSEQNFAPIGTGPFVVQEFRVNDVATFAANPHYHDPARPAFAEVVLKGGGDAEGAARAVLETGEFDYAWNTLIPPPLQAELAKTGQGDFVTGFGGLVERIVLNLSDPSPDLPEGARSTPRHPHPILSDLRVRRALSLAIDRGVLADLGYGSAGRPVCNLIPAPAEYASADTSCLTQDLAAAKALLDQAGWQDQDGDGVREKDGRPLALTFQTTVNPIRQDVQALVKSWWSEIGVSVTLRQIDAGVFFGSDPASPDTHQKFYADVQMYASEWDGTDPEPYLAQLTCDRIPGPENQWQAENIGRFCDPAFDAALARLQQSIAPDERAALIRALDTMVTTGQMALLPLVHRGRLSARANSLGGVVAGPWDAELSRAAEWYRIK
jgi:peptide/nickel transport system substrate-binding protein